MKGVTFGNKHSYTDFNLILSSVNIPPAVAKSNFLDIPGADGSLDLTEANGEVKYNDREITFTFSTLPTDNIQNKHTQVSNALNGIRFNSIKLDKDPNYYWVGRCFVDSYDENFPISAITVRAIVKPYKFLLNATTVSRNDLTTSYKNISLQNTGRKSVVPTITVAQATKVKVGTDEKELSAGTYKVVDFAFGTETITLKAKVTSGTSGSISITYQEGDL